MNLSSWRIRSLRDKAIRLLRRHAGFYGALQRIPLLRRLVSVSVDPPQGDFSDSTSYWQSRYREGGDSGAGSYDQLAEFKARVVNGLVRELSVASVIELGCGDGNQLRHFEIPRYLGVDVSEAAIERCRRLFAGDGSKRFVLQDEYAGERAQMALSLDVIFHLVEDEVFERYMQRLFASAERLVLIYSSNKEESASVRHVRHRRFSDWIEGNAPSWSQERVIANPFASEGRSESFSSFFLYAKSD